MSQLMEYGGFHAKINYNVETKALEGTVIDSRDLLVFRAFTVNDLQGNFQHCVEEYVESCRKKGINPTREYNGIIEIEVTKEMYYKIVMAANNQNITLEQFIENAIASYFKQE